ncbi:MAG: hypothetical protein MJE77_23520 [Proteobacteria bacterium]|nr:hypothetical protein [Pseudomonadota bacterium]
MRIAARPPDARIVIDGVPVVDNGQVVSLLPGVHVVYASAPGYVPNAFKARIRGGGDSLEVPLARVATSDPIDRLGPAWAIGDLRPHTNSGQVAIRALLNHLGADIAIVVAGAARRGTSRARIVTHREISESISGRTPTAALSAALSRLTLDGQLRPRTSIDPGAASDGDERRVPMYKRWWFWLGMGLLAGGALIGAQQTHQQSPTLQVFAR